MGYATGGLPMKKNSVLVLICSLLLFSGTVSAADNLHFTGNLFGKSCTPVINGNLLAEIHFPTIAASDLMLRGQSERVPLVFQLKDCKSATAFNVKVTLTGTEDTDLPGFLSIDSSSSATGVGIGIETAGGAAVPINSNTGATFPLNQGNNSVNFNTWLQAVNGRDVTSGDFTAMMTVTFEYF